MGGMSPIEPKEWEETMTTEEIQFINNAFYKIIKPDLEDPPYGACIDNYRAARIWKSSQRRRYFKQQSKGCCGFFDTIVQRWNPEKNRFDIYLIGFNYGH